jgi:hypothetical protein
MVKWASQLQTKVTSLLRVERPTKSAEEMVREEIIALATLRRAANEKDKIGRMKEAQEHAKGMYSEMLKKGGKTAKVLQHERALSDMLTRGHVGPKDFERICLEAYETALKDKPIQKRA